MNFKEIVDDVLSQLGEDPAAPVYWTRSEAEDAVNDGYEAMSEASEWFEVIITIPMASRRTYMDLRGYRYDILMVNHIYNLETNRPMQNRGKLELDNNYRQWEFNIGTPEAWFISAPFLGIWPRRNGEGPGMRTSATAIPDRLVRDTDTPGFPEEFHEGLTAFGKYVLKASDHSPQMALQYYAEYLGFEAKLGEWVKEKRDLTKTRVLGQW